MELMMNSFLQRRVVSFYCSICLLLLTQGNEVSETPREGLPFCGLSEYNNRYIFVSTLDGKLTALNPNDKGSVIWTIHPGSESLLSSSIHKLELSNYGHLVRMIPSLSGGLYKFNGENIEVIPITVDHLLQSSFRYSNDLVISGGKETQTFGVSLASGNIIYECSMKGCGNVSHATNGGEILVIQRLGQIVRAVEPRTGSERWNFSVAQHDLKLLSECHSPSSLSGELDYHLKVVVPEGIIYATDVKDSSKIIWKYKFNSPVVSAWQLNKGKLIPVDLFSSHQAPSLGSILPPSIYIGMHDKQLYIQESVMMLTKRQEIASKFKQKLIGNEKEYPRIPWKPISAGTSDLILQTTDSEQGIDEISQRQTTALSVLYASSYINGNGFYLYTEEELEKVKEGSCNTSLEAVAVKLEENDLYESSLIEADFAPDYTNGLSDSNTTVEIIVSFWYYWKEVLVISITTALLCNIMILRPYLKWKIKGLSKASEKKTTIPVKESDSGVDLKFAKVPEPSSVQDYTSRYLTDFDPVACLGKGGFGVVFEAKNKIDDCHYAIKRILLPSRQESRERVMREVKALAKLDHHHIVRYFNAWTECPPPGWQETHDRSWADMNSEVFTSNEATSNQTKNLPSDSNDKSSISLNVDKLYSSVNYPNRVQNLKEKLSSPKYDISDSFIVFDEGTQSRSSSKTKDKRNRDSVVTVSTDIEESIESNMLTKSERPTSLMLDQKDSLESKNVNKVYLYIQMQLCQRQSLKDWLTTNKERDYEYVLSIFEQILQAVEHVHLHGLIHRDLKPSNIFFSLDNQIKVGDFGLVTAMTEGDSQMSPVEAVPISVNERHTAQVGTQLYMSQEQLLGKPYSYKVDIYSLGVILFELLVPFSTQMERIQVLQDIKADKFPELFQDKYRNEHKLLRLMLSNSPDERPTTYGVRARLPLKQEIVEEGWHFDLPMRRRTYSKTSRTSTSSTDGSGDSP